jgi:hypothetical protein
MMATLPVNRPMFVPQSVMTDGGIAVGLNHVIKPRPSSG